ncbi:hypothetical protein D1872_303150 [compost metagenome]
MNLVCNERHYGGEGYGQPLEYRVKRPPRCPLRLLVVLTFTVVGPLFNEFNIVAGEVVPGVLVE